MQHIGVGELCAVVSVFSGTGKAFWPSCRTQSSYDNESDLYDNDNNGSDVDS